MMKKKSSFVVRSSD